MESADLMGLTSGQMVRRFRTAATPTADELRQRRRALSAQVAGLTDAEQAERVARRRGLTQEELVARSGLSVEGLRKIERGRSAPQPDTVRLLARALHLSAAQHAALLAAAERERLVRARQGSVAAATQSSLPVPLTSFVGRAVSVDTIRTLLAPEGNGTAGRPGRLLTLTGPGGCGKTRLALEVAASLHSRFVDGIYLVELGELPPTATDVPAVEYALAGALGLQGRTPRLSLAALIARLRDRHALVVLDNCEHLIAACRTLSTALLRACPDLHILATSREILGILGETIWPVLPLETPPADTLPDPDALLRYDAVALFVSRARAQLPDFALTHENAAAVARICRHLDGLPLALELAAARLPVLSPDQLAARLDDRFTLLTRGNGAAAPRQQTLRATMEWSFHLLDQELAMLLGTLSVFAGGWTFAAALSVCSTEALTEVALLDALTELAARSLLIAGITSSSARYRMLETVRHYAHLRLEESPCGPERLRLAHLRHLAWCGSLARWSDSESEERWLARLETEQDNLRAALVFGLQESSSVRETLDLASALWPFWLREGYLREGRQWLLQALAMPGASPTPGGTAQSDQAVLGARAAALHGAGRLAVAQGATAQAADFYIDSLSLAQALTDQPQMSLSLLGLASIATAQQQPDRAARLFSAAQVLHAHSAILWTRAMRAVYEDGVHALRAACGATTESALSALGGPPTAEWAVEYAGAICSETAEMPVGSPGAGSVGRV